MQAVHPRMRSTLIVVLACQMFFANTADAAVSVGLSDVPMFLRVGVEPNIYLTVDDSRSMGWSYMNDEINIIKDTDYNTKRAKSSTWNKLYYDPGKTYTVPVDAYGVSLGNAPFTAAWNDGFIQDGSGQCTVNLETSYRPTWGADGANNCDDTDKNDDNDGNEYSDDVEGVAERAYYYKYMNSTGDGDITNDENYTKVTIEGDVQKQNFANWYSYYRNRLLATKSAITESFSKIDTGFRLSYQKILAPQVLSTLAEYSGTNRSNFFDWISNIASEDLHSGTLLRESLINIGYKLQAEDNAPYRDDPTDPTSPARSCRQNFHIMLTDGEWSDVTNKTPLSYTVGNADNTSGATLGNGDSYTPRAPYMDGNVNFLADFAFKYWSTDLRSDLDNNVPVSIKKTFCTDDSSDCSEDDEEATFWHPDNDPADWQHLVNFIISFGLKGKLAYPDDIETLMSGTKNWTNHHIDDAWHAAINSRGSFFLAEDSKTLVEKLTEALKEIVVGRRAVSAAAVSMNSGSVSTDTRLYQVKFDSTNWTGQLLSLPISNGTSNTLCSADLKIGDICSTEWAASCKLDGGYCDETGMTEDRLDWNDRKIITYKPGNNPGIAFKWGSLSEDQQALLNGTDSRGEDRLNYIRGDKTYEASNYDANCPTCTFRNRKSLLGDLVNSNPTYVGAPSRIYPDNLEGDSATGHSTYRYNQHDRVGTVYVGGNDGMLHAFNSANGIERFAYIPNMVFPKLASLTDKDYSHTSFVDGQLDEGDVYYGSGTAAAWHTVLVGGLGYGGQGIYALDVTNPNNFNENHASSIVLWEYTDANENDLGYTYGKPAIRKLNNGKWAAIFGNGYDSTAPDGHASSTGDAAIYIVDIEDGSLIKKISTEKGTNEDPTEDSRPNGISGIQPVDINNDFKIDYLYAGDLFGNVWRFDLLGSDTDEWVLAFSGHPLFKAVDSSGTAQPITTITAVGRHETNVGTMVYFGTGKYLGLNDIADTSQQTFYGIWDSWISSAEGFSAPLRAGLLQQTLVYTDSTTFDDVDARATTNHSIDWATHKGWYFDLPDQGERVFQPPILRNGRIIFVTLTPGEGDVDPCEPGSTSWLMELDANSGSRLDTSPFDYDGNGVVDGDDLVPSGSAAGSAEVGGSGIRLDPGDGTVGAYTTPAVLNLPSENKERKYIGTSEGRVESIDESSHGRLNLSWREIMECGI